MYLEYFNFHSQPFSLSTQIKAFFKTPQHSTILNSTINSLEHDEFLIKITGPVGTGKTLIGHMLAKILKREHNVAYLPHPCGDSLSLLQSITSDLGFENVATQGMGELMGRLEEFLAIEHAQGRRVIFILDEVQTFDEHSLEMVRMLTNLEVGGKKLVQLVLFGQTELDDILNKHRWRQLKQRIVHHFYLEPLSPELTGEYIKFRQFHAGSTQGNHFNRLATKAVIFFSQGVPRAINVLCHKALLMAYVKGKRKVGLSEVIEAHFSSKRKNNSFKIFSYALLGLSLALITLGAPSELWYEQASGYFRTN